ncbi:MAG: hypothetical protein QOF96_3671 [Actinomycetota bacterium]|nr:hypothetical protein [Actinomycetota bacterium]
MGKDDERVPQQYVCVLVQHGLQRRVQAVHKVGQVRHQGHADDGEIEGADEQFRRVPRVTVAQGGGGLVTGHHVFSWP